MYVRASCWALAALVAAGCASTGSRSATPTPKGSAATTAPPPVNEGVAPFASTYEPLPSRVTVIRNATILTAAGPVIQGGSVLMRDGKVVAVGKEVQAPVDATVVDASGGWVTPGLIDIHSHLGDYPAPGVAAVSDGNEATNPNTAQVWAEHSVWPQDPQFALALAGGVTTIEILPGSANLFGGRSVVVKNVPARTVQAMKFPGAPYDLKMACGENPKRVYGNRGGPSTRMGNVAGYRAAWIKAEHYKEQWDKWRREGSDPDKKPVRDLQLETLMGVLNGQIRVQMHCYRADEMAVMLDVAKEFNYHIAAFHHAVEAYKIRDLLKQDSVCAVMWSDWWGFKLEAYDGIRQNIPLVDEGGGCAILHSDDPKGIQRLNQDAAKAMEAGEEADIHTTPAEAIRWITINPAKALGIDQWTGSLEPGKMADLVIWNGTPFSVYSRAQKVFIDGALIYDRNDPTKQPVSDFRLGTVPGEVKP